MKLLSTMLLAGTALVFAGSAQAQESYKIGGGPAGGGWHPAVSAGAQLLNSELDGKYKFNYSPSNGSVDNVRRVSLGKFDTAWGHIGQVFQAWNGVGLFEEDGANKDFRVIANVRKQSQIVAVLADSPIKTFSDMKGKIVNLLNKGSGSNVNCRNIMIGAGIIDSIETRNLGFSDSARALGDRQIDVFCSAGAPFLIPALTQLSITKPVRYISLTDEEQAAVIKTNPFYAPVTIPIQTDVKGMDAPAKSIAYDVFWLAHKDVSDEAVYDMLKVAAAPDNLKKLAATAAYWKTLNGDFTNLEVLKIPVHPAAAKYWGERGVDVPATVVQGY
ncbi:MAG: TAXI family TRAP transporter solute-binding subunit [Alphaproteobacteria bacterium]|nr:TAXI family TRAP transporter solute-binding subunit [Alphaproteobacteria bacterium]